MAIERPEAGNKYRGDSGTGKFNLLLPEGVSVQGAVG